MDDVFEYNQHFVAMMNIINASRLNPPEHGHRHHIIPQCWYRYNDMDVDNSDKNVVMLTAEDHAKIHKLAYLCAKDAKVKQAMAFAAHMMGQPVTNLHIIVSEETKQHMRHPHKKPSAELRSKMNKDKIGKSRPPEVCKKISDAQKGKFVSNETRARIRESMLNMKPDVRAATNAKISAANKGNTAWNKGMKMSDEYRAKLRKPHKTRKGEK
jgi:hypothetical protein